MAERIPVPKNIKVPDIFTDERRSVCEEWDAKEPGWTHVLRTQTNAADPRRMKKYMMEVVKDEEGVEIMCGNDVLCRVPTEMHRGIIEQGQKASRELVLQNKRDYDDEKERGDVPMSKDLDKVPKPREPVMSQEAFKKAMGG